MCFLRHTNNMNTKEIKKSNLIKFILCSLIGVVAFLVPIPYGDSFTTTIDLLKNTLAGAMGDALLPTVVGVVVFSTVMSVIDAIFKPSFIREQYFLKKAFSTSTFYLISKIIGAIVGVLVLFDLGPEFITSIDTGATIVGLCGTLFCIVLAFSFFLPFLTDCGVMEFLGVLLKPIIYPLFKVPGRASVDLLASWFGASNAAAIMTSEQYEKGYYNQREAGYIMTNFSLASIPFCVLIADTIGVSHLFPAFYLTICVVGIALAVIMARLAPISKLEDTYNETVGKQINEEPPAEGGLFNHALSMSCKRAESFSVKDVVYGGLEVVVSMLFDLIPVVIAWGTAALIIAEYTPVFTILSMPMGFYLDILGVEAAYQVAPATLVGFTDMFIPALLVASLESVKTKFIIGVLSLIQIVYLTEVGAIIIKSGVPLNVWKLFIIFLERTIIAIPIIVLMANILI